MTPKATLMWTYFQLDSASLFQSEYYAADTTVVGIVTMLSTIEALWKMKHDIENNTNAKDIMFTFFQGVSYLCSIGCICFCQHIKFCVTGLKKGVCFTF